MHRVLFQSARLFTNTIRHPPIVKLAPVLVNRSFSSEDKYDRSLFIQELLEKITENTNSLPPPLFTKKCCEYYNRLDKAGKIEFFNVLSKDFDVDRANVIKGAKEYIQIDSNQKQSLIQVEKDLQYYLEPKYNLFFDRIHQLPNGLKFLADMRRDLLGIMGHSKESETYRQYMNLEQDIRLRLKKYIIGFLKMERITWEHSSGELIEKICQYEAVHAVRDWKDIKRRLALDRRVYAFFEKNAYHEPLVFVHVALVDGMSHSVQQLLDAPVPDQLDPAQVKCGICYSITTQEGLGGINLGNYLIKQVVESLKLQYPQIHTFATLSPIPGFRKWISANYSSIQSEFENIQNWQTKLNRFDSKDQVELEKPLMRLCSRYILSEKRQGKHALDPVANFHLRNGACAHQIHWKADISTKGIQESFGIMINYNYIADKIESNHRQYQRDGTIAISEPNQNGYLSNHLNIY